LGAPYCAAADTYFNKQAQLIIFLPDLNLSMFEGQQASPRSEEMSFFSNWELFETVTSCLRQICILTATDRLFNGHCGSVPDL
jgi:hypothetical protein